MPKPVIKIENLSKLYRIGEIGTGTISHDLNRWWTTKVRGKEDPFAKVGHVNDRAAKAEKDEHVWALKDINLEVNQGDILGIIGKNGAGKSTLLKLLSRVTSPTTGSIKVKGRLASLLEVGTGFHPEMTGRENIYMNGTIMGMRRWEIDKKLEEIIDFAGIEKYIDTPTKRYSSGMTVRLGFAIAAFLEPEILIVDEVLAVGDAEFQKKAIGKMQDVSKGEGRTVLFVSHNMVAVKNLTKKVIVLENGSIIYVGSTQAGIQYYLNINSASIKKGIGERYDRQGDGSLKFENVIIKSNGTTCSGLQSGCVAEFEIYYSVKQAIRNVSFRVMIVDSENNLRFVCSNFHSSEQIANVERNGKASLIIPKLPLPKGIYFYHLTAATNGEIVDHIELAGKFYVEAGDFFKTGRIPGLLGGLFVDHKWL